MKKIILLLISTILLSFQVKSVMLSCHDPVYKIGYINGIQNDKDEAKNNLRKMRVEVGDFYYDQQFGVGSKIKYFNAYNPTNFLPIDLAETNRIYALANNFEEIRNNSQKGYEFRLAFSTCSWGSNIFSSNGVNDLLMEECKKKKATQLKAQNADANKDYAKISTIIHSELLHPITKLEDPMIKMMLVNHSEGTLFGNKFYQDYVLTGGTKVSGKRFNTRAHRFGLYNIATPASYVASKNFLQEAYIYRTEKLLPPLTQNDLYTTSIADWTIGLAPVVDFGRSLPSNVNVGFFGFFSEGHNLATSYLSNPLTRNKIVKDIHNQFARLNPDVTAFSVKAKTLGYENMPQIKGGYEIKPIANQYSEWYHNSVQMFKPDGSESLNNFVLGEAGTNMNQEFAISCENLNVGNYDLRANYDHFNAVLNDLNYVRVSYNELDMQRFYFEPTINVTQLPISNAKHQLNYYTYPTDSFSQGNFALTSRLLTGSKISNTPMDIFYKGRSSIGECYITNPTDVDIGGLLYDEDRRAIVCNKHSYPYYNITNHKTISTVSISKNNGQYYMDIF